jgi:hypothetical protein
VKVLKWATASVEEGIRATANVGAREVVGGAHGHEKLRWHETMGDGGPVARRRRRMRSSARGEGDCPRGPWARRPRAGSTWGWAAQFQGLNILFQYFYYSKFEKKIRNE